MHISNLNVRIIFQKNAVVIDKIGNHTNEWQDYYSCHATVSGETGTEQAIVGETVENVEVCFSVRYCEKISSIISTKYRIIFRNEIYDIIAVDHFSYTKKYLKFMCRKARR